MIIFIYLFIIQHIFTIRNVNRKNLFTLLSIISVIFIGFNTFYGQKIEQVRPLQNDDLPFVKDLDFKRFMGLWYNIASLPNIIQSRCKCAQTFDTLVQDLVIQLQQSCLIFGKNVTSKSKAIATVPHYGNWTNVNGPAKAPYWVVQVDSNYQWAILGQPSRKGFWIIARNYQIDQTLLNTLINRGKQLKFDLKQLQMQDQSCWKHQQLITLNNLQRQANFDMKP